MNYQKNFAVSNDDSYSSSQFASFLKLTFTFFFNFVKSSTYWTVCKYCALGLSLFQTFCNCLPESESVIDPTRLRWLHSHAVILLPQTLSTQLFQTVDITCDSPIKSLHQIDLQSCLLASLQPSALTVLCSASHFLISFPPSHTTWHPSTVNYIIYFLKLFQFVDLNNGSGRAEWLSCRSSTTRWLI